jgi:hypothetical protein
MSKNKQIEASKPTKPVTRAASKASINQDNQLASPAVDTTREQVGTGDNVAQKSQSGTAEKDIKIDENRGQDEESSYTDGGNMFALLTETHNEVENSSFSWLRNRHYFR